MIFISKASDNCLFCNQKCDSNRTEEEDEEELECSCHHHPRFLGSLPFRWEDNKIFHSHLKYVFVLRKLLDYPRGKCVQYLKQRSVENAQKDGWFSVCSKCSKLVEEGHEIYHEIEALETRLDALKQNLKETLVKVHDGGNDATIHSEVRNHFAPSTITGNANDGECQPFPDQSIVKQEVLGDPEDVNAPNEDFDNNDDDNEFGFSDHSNDDVQGSESDWSPNDNEIGMSKQEPYLKLHVRTSVNPENDVENVTKDSGSNNVRRSMRRSKKRQRISESESEEEPYPKKISQRNQNCDTTDTEGDGPNEKNKCHVCCAVYGNHRQLMEHVDLHSRKDGVLKCKKCPFVCLTERGLIIHSSKKHRVKNFEKKRKTDVHARKSVTSALTTGNYTCSHCGVSYQTAHRLKEHEDLHSRDDVLKCDQCNFVCLVERGMKIHVTKIHNKESEEHETAAIESQSDSDTDSVKDNYSCSHCGTIYKTAHRLKEHEDLHSRDDVLKCDREDCNYVSLFERGMKIHVTKAHSKDMHPTTAEGDAESDNYPCSLCGVTYSSPYRLKEHVDLHSRDDVLKCDHCEYVSLYERGMKIHVTRSHPNETAKEGCAGDDTEETGDNNKCRSCSICGTVYKTAHRLKEHEDLHSRDDVRKCVHCKYVCLFERGMLIHVTKAHKDTTSTNQEDGGEANAADDDEATTKLEKPYSCKICCASYTTRRRLKEHKLLHNNPDAKKCTECPFVCQMSRNLKVHIGRVHGNDRFRSRGPFKCARCPAVYQTSHRFKEHLSLHKGSSISCPTCGWAFSSQEKCDRHVELRHQERNRKRTYRNSHRNQDGPFNCEHCSAVYKDRYRFKEHVQIYHQDKLIECELCKQLYESKPILEDHKKICKGPKEEVDDEDDIASRHVYCPFCNAQFSTKSKLNRHIDLEHSKDRQKCPYCDAVFPTKTKLIYHKSRVHGDVHNVCKVCGYKAHGPASLTLHMQKHTKQKMYMCEICSKTFVSQPYLAAHKQKIHYEELGLEPIKCDECGLLVPTQSILKYHKKKVHEKEYRFFCEVCGKGFLFLSLLRNHSAVHSTERNEICQFCGAAYVHNRVLMDHIKNHHPEEYAVAKGIDPATIPQPSINNQGPFICKFCNMEFEMRWGLHSHLKTHTEVYDKYKCSICGKGYSSPAGLKRHEETAHLAETFNCQYCGKEFSCRDYVRYHVKNHCKKKNEATVSAALANDDDTEEKVNHESELQETDPHVLNKSGQLHIVLPSTSSAMHDMD